MRRLSGGWGIALTLTGALVALGILASCATPRGPAPAAPPPGAPITPSADVPAALPAGTGPAAPAIVRPGARWVPVGWPDLPGWATDRPSELWPALRAGCAKPAAGWEALCARAAAFTPPDDGFARDFLERELQPYRVEAPDGGREGLATGYFEPLIAASRLPRPGFGVPLYRPPADLAQRRPYWTRQQLDTDPAARTALRGHEIAWLASPLDALMIQVQGSGRLKLTEADGREHLVRLAFAGHNDQPYRSVGRWLIEQGELSATGANWPAIRDWGERARQSQPARLNAMLWSNPRVVFFREEALPDETLGPRGAQGVPLTAGRSVAVDPQAVPYGTVLWLDTTEPLSARPLQRLAMAQDTGSAISGAVRVDLFFGTGIGAELQAGRMKQPLRLYALWPR